MGSAGSAGQQGHLKTADFCSPTLRLPWVASGPAILGQRDLGCCQAGQPAPAEPHALHDVDVTLLLSAGSPSVSVPHS